MPTPIAPRPAPPAEEPDRDFLPCSGCGERIPRRLIACKSCWRTIPGELKAELGTTLPGTIGRVRVVGKMRRFLQGGQPDAGAAQ